MKRITYADLDRWNTCCRKDGEKYSNDNLAKHGWGPEGITPLELSTQRWIPVEDRVWGLLREDVLGDELQPVMDEIADGVVLECCQNSGVPEAETWAKKWLSGEDRSKESARSAFSAAFSAARSARYRMSEAEYAVMSVEYAGGPDAKRKEINRQFRIIRKTLKVIE